MDIGNLHCKVFAIVIVYKRMVSMNWSEDLRRVSRLPIADVHECDTGVHKCHKDARCVNTIGSYRCECNDGLAGNGFICNEPALFKDSPSTQRVTFNDKISLSCSYYNSTGVKFEWMKDYEILRTSAYNTTHVSVMGSGGISLTTHHLMFQISSVAEQGHYWCRLNGENAFQRDSRKATVILKDSSATRMLMEVNEKYNNLLNISTSSQHLSLRNKISAAIKTYMTNQKSPRTRRNVESDPTVRLENIRSSTSGNTRLDAIVYYRASSKSKKLGVCQAMQNITSNGLQSPDLEIVVISRTSYDCCYSSSTGNPDIKGVIYWQTQVIDQTSVVACPARIKQENATRLCQSFDFEREPAWQSPDTSTCLYVREVTQKLSQLSEDVVNSSTVIGIVSQLEEVTRNETNIKTYVDVALAVDVIVNVASSQSNNTEAFNGIVNVTNSLMSADTAVVKDAQKNSNASEKLVRAVEKFADNIPLPENKTTQTFSKKNLAIGIKEVPKDVQQNLEENGFVITGSIGKGKTIVEMKEESNKEPQTRGKVADLKLPGSLFKVAKKIRDETNATDILRLTTLLYDNAKLFSSKETSGDNSVKKINSKVLAVGIKGLKLENLTEEERVRSEFQQQLKRNEWEDLLCVYWEETQQEWSQRGCRYDGLSGNDKLNAKCSCNHMTNFALLLDVTQDPSPESELKEVMKYFTYIGCGLSLAGLAITIFTLSFFKKLRQKIPQKIIIWICFSLILALIAFLVTTQYTSRVNEENGMLIPTSQVVCLVSSIATHYFVLCAFLWMTMQSYYLYLSCVKVMRVKKSNIFIWMTCSSFGVPLIIVTIVLGIHNKEFKNFTNQEKVYANATSLLLMDSNSYVRILDQRNRICMINGISFYAAYLAPIVVMLITNFTFLILSLRGIFGSARKTGNKGFNKKRKLRIVLSCVVLIGLTWIIGVFAIGPLKTTLQILFTILNSLQGVFIFLFYCLLNSKVQEQWRVFLGYDERGEASSQSSKKTNLKTSKGLSSRFSRGKKEPSSSVTQSESKVNEYNISLRSLYLEFAGRAFQTHGVFSRDKDGPVALAFEGPPQQDDNIGMITRIDEDPNIATSL